MFADTRIIGPDGREWTRETVKDMPVEENDDE
jgi:hypothetical protein